ncbi:hypothetical protein [Gaetbulibacter sp. PBL-D1]|uniref:hypothetical protein n=1 Tax=Gaetbulibacter sp. PBL-D1 TaxID=3422594 RepID=UPI003D2EEAE7
MKRVLSIILAIVAIASFAFDIVVDNAELWNIPANTIAIVSSIIFAIQQFVEKLKMFTEDEVISFGNYISENNPSAKHSADASVKFKQWKEHFRE